MIAVVVLAFCLFSGYHANHEEKRLLLNDPQMMENQIHDLQRQIQTLTAELTQVRTQKNQYGNFIFLKSHLLKQYYIGCLVSKFEDFFP
jgi:hypothetical protein